MATLNKQVIATADSGYIYPSSVDTTSGWCGWDGTDPNHAFNRFTGITIPQGAQITSAYIQYKAMSSIGLAGLLTSIYLSKEANAASPTTYAAYNAKTPTTAFTNWDAPSAWASGTWYNSPDISAAVQEVINQGAWSSGNAMLILHKNRKSGAQSTITYNVYANGAANAPKLVINYSLVDNRNGSFTTANASGASATGKKGASGTVPVTIEHSISLISVKQAKGTFASTNTSGIYMIGKNRMGSFWTQNASDATMSGKKGAKLASLAMAVRHGLNISSRKNSFSVFAMVNHNMILVTLKETVIDGELIIYMMFDTVTEIANSYDV